jgi:hypothetical protein
MSDHQWCPRIEACAGLTETFIQGVGIVNLTPSFVSKWGLATAQIRNFVSAQDSPSLEWKGGLPTKNIIRFVKSQAGLYKQPEPSSFKIIIVLCYLWYKGDIIFTWKDAQFDDCGRMVTPEGWVWRRVCDNR